MPRTKKEILVLSVAVAFFLYEYFQTCPRIDELDSGTLLILIWTNYWGGPPPAANDIQCKDWCKITHDRCKLSQSSAVVWHGTPEDMDFYRPKVRKPNQPWVFWLREPPYPDNNYLKDYASFFNWTMTYRRDSDVVYGYGTTEPLLEASPNKQSCRRRDKFAVAVISNCNSNGKREELIKLLRQRGLSIDVFGRCGTPIDKDFDIWTTVQDYKYYLAFENSLCTDYVTEKLFRTFELDVIPVVYGKANYSQVAPPKSFIDVNDFTSLHDLITFLTRIGGNLTEYCEYFEWRNKWRVVLTRDEGFCRLCEKVRQEEALGWRNKVVIDDLYGWWTGNYSYVSDNYKVCTSPEREWWWQERNIYGEG